MGMLKIGKKYINPKLITEVYPKRDGPGLIAYFATPDGEGQASSGFDGEEADLLREWLDRNSETLQAGGPDLNVGNEAPFVPQIGAPCVATSAMARLVLAAERGDIRPPEEILEWAKANAGDPLLNLWAIVRRAIIWANGRTD